MRPRMRKFLAGLLSLGLLLQAASPLSALADSGTSTAPGLTVTVNDTDYTLTVDSSGQLSVPSGWTEADLPTVSYDAGTYTFTGTLGTTSNDMAITLSGTGSPNVVLKNPDGRAVLATTLTVNNVNDFRAESGGDQFTLTCDSTIACTGNVELKSNTTVSYPGYSGFPLTITSAKDVTIEGTGSDATLYTTKITCSGKLSVKNTGTGPVLGTWNTLWVYDAGSVELTSRNADCTAATVRIEKCTNSVELANTGSGKAVGVLLVGKSDFGTTTYTASSVTVNGGIDTYAKIYCDGDIDLTGDIPGNGPEGYAWDTDLMSQNGNVTVTGIDGNTVPLYLINGPLNVKGDHVTLKGRATVAIIKDYNSTSTTHGGIVAEANVLEVQNTSPSGHVGYTKVVPDDSMNYRIYLDADHTPQTTVYISELRNNAEITSDYLYVSATPKVVDNSELKITVGDQEFRVGPTDKSVQLPDEKISVTHSGSDYKFYGQFATRTVEGGDYPKVTIEGVNGKKPNLTLDSGTLDDQLPATLGELEIKNMGDVSLENPLPGDLTLTDVGDVNTRSVDGSVTATNAGNVTTATVTGSLTATNAGNVYTAVGGNLTLTNVNNVTYADCFGGNGTIDITASGEVSLYGGSTTNSQIAANATITAKKLTMRYTGSSKNGTVGHVNFTRTDTISAYRILTGENKDNITRQTVMTDATFNQTVDAVYLCIEPGEVVLPSYGFKVNGQDANENTLPEGLHYADGKLYASEDYPGDLEIEVTRAALKLDVELNSVAGAVTLRKVNNVAITGTVTGDLTINGAADVSVKAKNTGSAALSGSANITCSGKVELLGADACAISANGILKYTPDPANGSYTVSLDGTGADTIRTGTYTETTNPPSGDALPAGALYDVKSILITPASNGGSTEPDDTPDDTPASISGGDSGAGGAIAAVALGSAAVWGGYQVATRVILHKLLPEGAAIPANRGQLALLVWNEAGRPEPANAPAFTDVADADTAKAAQWCTEQGYLDAKTESTFKPDGLVTKVKVIEVWNTAFPKN